MSERAPHTQEMLNMFYEVLIEAEGKGGHDAVSARIGKATLEHFIDALGDEFKRIAGPFATIQEKSDFLLGSISLVAFLLTAVKVAASAARLGGSGSKEIIAGTLLLRFGLKEDGQRLLDRAKKTVLDELAEDAARKA